MFVLNARPHSETGVSPYVSKFGTTDGILFRPDLHERYEGTNQYIRHLDDTLALVRQVAQDALDKRTGTRQAKNPLISTQYQPGDFLLFSVPKMYRNSKLSTPWSGPYKVIAQRNNDIECQHLSSGIIHSLHCNRVKLFMGSRDEAYNLACLDDDQHTIVAILAHMGPPDQRSAMQFLVQFADNVSLWLPWSRDLSNSIPFGEYCQSTLNPISIHNIAEYHHRQQIH